MSSARQQSIEVETPPGVGRGSIREVSSLAVPVILTQLSITAMGFVDSAMVGRLGATELAAVGFAGIWIWTCFNFFYGAESAVQTFVSQAWGAERLRDCGAWTWQALYMAVPCVTLTALAIGLFVEPLLALLGPSTEMQSVSAAYLRPVLFGAPGVAIGFALTSFFRGLGDTRTPLYATLVANVVNAVLDYGLIFGELGMPRLGVFGAGLATAVGQWVYAVYMIVCFARTSLSQTYATGRVPPDPAQMRRLIRTGAPIGGQWVIGMLSFAVFSTVIARMGDESAAASQAFVVLLSVSFMQAIGISIASSTLVGRYIGAGDLPAARRSFWNSQKLAGTLGAAIAVLYIAIPELLLRIFTDDPEVIRLGRALVIVGAVFQFFDAFGIVAGGSLRGAGDTRWPFLVQTLFAWGMFVPLAYLFGVTLEGGVFGAWLGGALYVGALAVVFVWRFRAGAWESMEI